MVAAVVVVKNAVVLADSPPEVETPEYCQLSCSAGDRPECVIVCVPLARAVRAVSGGKTTPFLYVRMKSKLLIELGITTWLVTLEEVTDVLAALAGALGATGVARTVRKLMKPEVSLCASY